MGLLIGMDEAGYGPNLGPLVVTVTAWEVPGRPHRANPWSDFAAVLTSEPARGDSRLHIGDSKKVYSSGKGIASLERSVLAALGILDRPPASFRDLTARLLSDSTDDPTDPKEPWFTNPDWRLPLECPAAESDGPCSLWKEACATAGIRLRAIRSDVVFTPRFNRMTSAAGSKGVALSRISLRLLRQVWDPAAAEPTLIIADKHGGRNRYDDLLEEILDGEMLFRRKEGAELSEYRVGRTDIRFQTRAEEHFPVAIASMVSKYVREASMEIFNAWWAERLPGLKPTKGYPEDARRFRQDIAALQASLGIPDAVLWREK